MPFLYKTLIYVLAAYLCLLFAVNLIPHIRVKSLRWRALHGVEISTPNATIKIGKITLRFNSLWSKLSFKSPFKMITLAFQDTVILERAVEKDLEKAKDPSKSCDPALLFNETIAFVLPKWVYRVLVNRSWMNDLTLQFFHFSIFHHVMHQDVSVHFAYLKLECTYKENKAQFGATVLDCFIKDKSHNCSLSSLRLFHNLELSMACTANFSCPRERRNRIVANLSGFEFALIFGELHIPKLSFILEKARPQYKGGDSHSNKPRLDLRIFFQKLNLINLVQIKFDQSVIEFKELKIAASSYSVAFSRDQGFKQKTLGKISSNITLVKLYHHDLTCLELPSLTYILDLDWTDFVRASKLESPDDFQVNVSTMLSMTNPAFNVFFDQFSFFFDVGNEHSKNQCKLGEESNNLKKQKDFVKIMAKKFKRIGKFLVKIVIVDLKGCLHMPSDENVKFHRNSLSNIITNAGSQGLIFKSSSKNIGNLLNEKKLQSLASIKSFFKVRNLYAEVAENKVFLSGLNSLTSYSLQDHKIALRVSCKSFQLKSVNTMIFHVFRRIRDERIKRSNYACEKMKQSPEYQRKPLWRSPSTAEIEPTLMDIFGILPPIFHSIKFRANLILIYIVCNDSLPSHIIYDKKLNQEVDLGEFKRGVSYSATDLRVNYLRKEEIFDVLLKQFQASTLSEYSREYTDEFCAMPTHEMEEEDNEDTFSVESGLSGFSSIDSEDDVKTVRRVLLIENIQLLNPAKETNKLVLTIPEIHGSVDTFLLWCLMYAHTLVKMISPNIQKTYTKEQKKQLKVHEKKLSFDVVIGSCTTIVRAAHNVVILLEIDSLHLRDALIQPHCQLGYLRLYVVHPTTKNWARMVSIKDTYIDLDSVTRTSITLSTQAIRLNIPFQYLVYTVIDNIITSVKAAHQIQRNFENLSKDNNDFSRMEPLAKEAIRMPTIRWKAKVFGLTLESDPFETELSLIFEFGLIENVDRQRKAAIFEKKARSIRSRAKDSLTEAHVDTRRFLAGPKNKHRLNFINRVFFGYTKSSDLSQNSSDSKSSKKGEGLRTSELKGRHSVKANTKEPKTGAKTSNIHKESKASADDSKLETKNSQTSPKDLEPISENGRMGKSEANQEAPEGLDEVSEEDKEFLLDNAETLIAEAHDLLMEDFSTSWINKYKAFKQSKFKSWDHKMTSVWGEDKVNDLMRSQFDIQDYSQGPPQFHSAFMDFDLHVADPELPDIHQFLHDYGKGQPRLDYSILIPLQIHLRSSHVYMSPRDYSLPLLLFPENSDPSAPVMDFKGTVVINEKLFSIKEELRQIFVPISPAITEQDESDNFYSLTVIRTLTPVKTMFDVAFELNSDQSCMISWCKAYQPALLNISMAFQNFTKPEIDDSPLGWWDKMALNAHGRASFDIRNDLCLHIKSGLSPYLLLGKNSGLIFCWKDNVKLRINEKGKHDELLTVISDDFILAIPDYANIEGKPWSPLDKKFDDDANSVKFQKRIMKLTSDEGVKWSLGFLFERNIDKSSLELSSSMKRTHHFKPHYDVTVTGPQYDYHPDSYEEFRSDYLHLAISVKSTSSKGNSHNYAYLTPLTIDYFKAWWHTLNHNASLPIREGKLFALLAFKDSPVKFGAHLFTFKYQLIIEPLNISHVVFASGGRDVNHSVLAYGIKGMVKSCCIDLHQRREFVRYINEKLGIDRRFRKLKLNLGEVEVSDADIRLIYAQFSDLAVEGKLLSYYNGEVPNEVNLEDYENDIKEQNFKNRQSKNRISGDFDSLWIDYDDFIELEEDDVLFPDSNVKVTPFFSTPKFTFFREFTLEVPEGKYPFGHEPSHNCLIGVNSPKEIQAQLIQRRMVEVKNQVRKDEHKLKRNIGRHAKDILSKEIDHGKDKISRLQRILDGVTSFSSDFCAIVSNNSSNCSFLDDESSELQKVALRAASTYLAIKSIDQANEVVNANSSLSNYHNRYLIHNLKMLWNNDVSEIFSPFLRAIGKKRTERIAMSTKALELMEKILKNAKNDTHVNLEDPRNIPEAHLFAGEDVIEAFEDYLCHLQFDNSEIEFGSLVKFIRPQVAFLSNSDPDSSIILTSQDIELRVLDENIAGTNDIISKDEQEVSLIETRYGVLFRESSVFVFNVSNSPSASSNHYGISQRKYAWPHWIDVEYSEDNCGVFSKNLVIERTTMALSLKKPNMLSIETSMKQPKKSEFVVHLKKLVVNATSSQYSAIYFIVTDLFSREDKNSLGQRLKQISSVSEASDFTELADKVKMLQSNIRVYRYLLLKFSRKNLVLTPENQRQRSSMRLELHRMRIELMIIIKGLEIVSSHNNIGAKDRTRNWVVNADQIIMHLLEDSREPLVDFALANCKFNRSDEANGSNSNFIDVEMIQGFNLQKDASYPELLRPFFEANELPKTAGACDPSRSMINMHWEMLNPVGGIRVMKNAELKVQPINVQLDYDTATKLFNYLFPKADADNETSALEREEGFSSGDDMTDGIDSFDSLGSPQSSKTFKNIFRRTKLRSPDHSSLFSSNKESSGAEDTSAASTESSAGHERKVVEKARRRKNLPKRVLHDEISQIIERSSHYFVVGDFKVHEIKLRISFQTPKHLNIIDVHNLVFSIPMIHYKDKTWTSNDFAVQLRKDIIKIFLANSGKIIGNKFKLRKRKHASTPLKQISDYSHFMTLDDLQEEGRARDEIEVVRSHPDVPVGPDARVSIPHVSRGQNAYKKHPNYEQIFATGDQ